MRRILIVVLFSALIAPVAGQTLHDKTRPGSNAWRGGTDRFFFSPGSFRHHGGFFPLFPVGRAGAGSLFLNRFLFFDHRPTAAGRGYDHLFSSRGYSPYAYYSYCDYPRGGFGWPPYDMQYFGYQGFGPMPTLYNSARFVEEWQDRDPFEREGSESQDSTLRQSILLKDGMDEDQVVGAIGAPVQRVQLGERTVWKYSGYSLLFEGGKLKEIR